MLISSVGVHSTGVPTLWGLHGHGALVFDGVIELGFFVCVCVCDCMSVCVYVNA